MLIAQIICVLEKHDLLRHAVSLLTKNCPSTVRIKTEKDVRKLLDKKYHELGMQEELKVPIGYSYKENMHDYLMVFLNPG